MESGRLSFTNGWQTGGPRNHRHPDVFGQCWKARCTHRGMRRWPGWNGFGVLACVALEEHRYRDIKGVISNFLRVTVTGDTGLMRH